MSKSWSATLARVALALVMALLVGCAKPVTPTAAPTRTPKPTFTPGAQAQAPTQAQVATAAQATLAPTLTPANSQATAAQPTTAKPTEAAKATEANSPAATEAPKATATVALPAVKSLKMNSPEYGMQALSGGALRWVAATCRRSRTRVLPGSRSILAGETSKARPKALLIGATLIGSSYTANHDGIDLVVRIDHQPEWTGGGFPTNGPPDNMQDLNDFLSAMATRYKGRIRAYEIWNEPNLAREWGGKLPDPGQYAKMLKGAYSAIKTVDPDAMVMSAGLSPTGTWNEEARPDEGISRVSISLWADRATATLMFWPPMRPGSIIRPKPIPPRWRQREPRSACVLLPPCGGFAQDHGRKWRFCQADRHPGVWLDERPAYRLALSLARRERGNQGRLLCAGLSIR